MALDNIAVTVREGDSFDELHLVIENPGGLLTTIPILYWLRIFVVSLTTTQVPPPLLIASASSSLIPRRVKLHSS